MNVVPLQTRDTAVYALVRPLFDPGIAVAVTDPRAAHYRPLPQECGAMARMAPVRQRAYAAGRAAAHDAMTALDQRVRPVLMMPDRAPLWPEGLTGSISHSQSCCIAALGQTARFRSLGVDVEEDADLSEDLIATICTHAERSWLSTQPRNCAGILAKLIFSAKECAYKCQYPLSKTLFGFDALEVTPDLDTGQFETTFLKDVPQFSAGTRLHGRFALGQGLIVTTMDLAN